MPPTHFTQDSHRGRRFTKPTVVQYDDAADAFHAGVAQGQESHNGQRFRTPAVVQYDDAAHAYHAGVAQGPTIYKPYSSISQLFNMTMLPTHFTQESHKGQRFTNPTVVQYDDAACRNRTGANQHRLETRSSRQLRTFAQF